MVEVMLPNIYTGKDLADAIEDAGSEMGYKIKSESNSKYIPGSVHEVESTREIELIKPEKITLREALKRMIFNLTSQEETSLHFLAKLARKYKSIDISVYVKDDYGKILSTSDPHFKPYKAEFERFVAALYSTLENKKPAPAKG